MDIKQNLKANYDLEIRPNYDISVITQGGMNWVVIKHQGREVKRLTGKITSEPQMNHDIKRLIILHATK